MTKLINFKSSLLNILSNFVSIVENVQAHCCIDHGNMNKQKKFFSFKQIC